MLRDNIYFVTYLATPLGNELYEPLQGVTLRAMAETPLRDKLETSLPKVKSSFIFDNDLSNKFKLEPLGHVAWLTQLVLQRRS